MANDVSGLDFVRADSSLQRPRVIGNRRSVSRWQLALILAVAIVAFLVVLGVLSGGSGEQYPPAP